MEGRKEVNVRKRPSESERARGSRQERRAGHGPGGAAGIITADLRVMGAQTRREPARSLAEHGRGGRPRGYVPVFDNGLTDEWRGRCDLHACHLDRLSLARSLAQAAPLNVNVKERG